MKQPRRWEIIYLNASKQEIEERLSEEEFAAALDKDTKESLEAIYILSGIIGIIFAYLTYTYDTTIGLFNNLSSFLFRTVITTLVIASVYWIIILNIFLIVMQER